MEQKLALINAIALLQNEHELPVSERTGHGNLLKKVCSLVKLPSMAADGDDRSALISIRQLILDVVDDKLQYNGKIIKQKLRIICSFDPDLFKIFESVLNDPIESELEARQNISNYIAQLRLFNNRVEQRRLISKASFALNDDSGDSVQEDIIKELRDELEKINVNTSTNGEHSGFVERVMSNDSVGMTSVFESTKKQLSGATLKCGWIGINNMLGINDGFVPGEMWVIPALPHNGKTTWSLSAFLSLGIFNKPDEFVSEGKTPLMLDISLENELNVNLPIAYQMLYGHFEKQPIDIKSIDPQFAAEYVAEVMGRNGWVYSFERYNSSEFTIELLRAIIADYEAKGYQIVGLRVDYLGVSNKTGLSNGTIGSEVREMYRRTRNTTSPKKILMFSPHQLSPAAKQLRAMDPNYLKTLPGKGMYDGCTTVDNEVDGELFVGVRDNCVEVQRGKHRTIVDTPLSKRYRVLRFSEVGVLPWDYDSGVDTSMTSINADMLAAETSDYFDSF